MSWVQIYVSEQDSGMHRNLSSAGSVRPVRTSPSNIWTGNSDMEGVVLSGQRPHQCYCHLNFVYGPMGLRRGQKCKKNNAAVFQKTVT